MHARSSSQSLLKDCISEGNTAGKRYGDVSKTVYYVGVRSQSQPRAYPYVEKQPRKHQQTGTSGYTLAVPAYGIHSDSEQNCMFCGIESMSTGV